MYFNTMFGRNHHNLDFTRVIEAEKQTFDHCNKEFHLKDCKNNIHSHWKLPTNIEKATPWKDNILQQLKCQLNGQKEQVQMHNLHKWHKHTQAVNPASNIPYIVKTRMRPELTTQAFLKFYEILHRLPVVPVQALSAACFNSVHLCEAPGAFVVAVNHFLALAAPQIQWKWLANSLNPYLEGLLSKECIADDRFIIHTLSNWFFGSDEKGDITDPSLLEELQKEVCRRDMQEVQLVTADGSIDCQGNPAEQEATTHVLHLAEVNAALSIIANGGSLVLKIFTFFESSTVSMLYILCCVFQNVHVVKPTASKLGNSEVYIVAINYQQKSCSSLFAHLNNGIIPIQFLPESFVFHIRNCAQYFMEHQIFAIHRNIKLFEEVSPEILNYEKLLKSNVVKHFINTVNCSKIPLNKRIIQNEIIEWDNSLVVFSNKIKWGEEIKLKTNVDRFKFLNRQFDLLLQGYSAYLMSVLNIQNVGDSWIVITKDIPKFDFIFKVSRGVPFHQIYSSRYCCMDAINLYKQYLDIVEDNEFFEADVSSVKKDLINKFLQQLQTAKLLSIKSQVLIEGESIHINGTCESLEVAIESLCEDNISDEIVFVNVPLLTRLQIALFHIVSCAYECLTWHFSDKKCSLPPAFVFSNPKSDFTKIKYVYKELQASGWQKGGSAASIHNVFNVKDLIKHPFHSLISVYNTIFCIHNSKLIKDFIQ